MRNSLAFVLSSSCLDVQRPALALRRSAGALHRLGWRLASRPEETGRALIACPVLDDDDVLGALSALVADAEAAALIEADRVDLDRFFLLAPPRAHHARTLGLDEWLEPALHHELATAWGARLGTRLDAIGLHADLRSIQEERTQMCTPACALSDALFA